MMLHTNLLGRFKQSNLLRGFASTTIWGGLSKLFTLVVTFYCSNTLSKEGFGEYSFVKNTLNMVLVICATHFSSLAVKFATESMQSIISLKRLYILVGFIITVGLVCGILILAIPLEIIQSFTGGESVSFFVKVMGLLLPVFILQPIVASILRGYKEFNRAGIYETAVAFFFLLITVAGVQLWGYHGAIYAILAYYAINSIIGVVVLWSYNKKKHYIGRVDELRSERKVLWTMIVPVFLMSFVEAPLNWVSQAEMGRRATYAMVGSLSVIMSIRYIIQILPTYFYQAFIPHATQLFANGKHEEYYQKYKQISRALLLILLVVIPLLIVFGKFLLSLYGKGYVENYPSLLLSLAIIPMLLYGTLFKTNMIIHEHQRIMLWMTIISSVLYIGFFYILILNGVNALDSVLIAQSLQYAVQLVYGLLFYLRDKKAIREF